MLKDEYCQPTILLSSKNIFQGKEIIKTFSNEGKLKEFVTSKTYSKRIARGNS